ncbi:MAG: MFS transporter [Clostridiaceae bacterium]|nr:MFS transporter [Clostridiaceae bacterium]
MALGVVRDELIKEFHITSTTFGYLGSTYFYVYMMMQIPSGILADTLGARKTVASGTILAAVGSMIFGLAPSIGYVFLGRLLVGLGVSVVLICILKILSQWFMIKEFATMAELYQKAFMYCFIAVIISSLASFFIKETYCVNIYKDFSEKESV